jgi:hypothetical protein
MTIYLSEMITAETWDSPAIINKANQAKRRKIIYPSHMTFTVSTLVFGEALNSSASLHACDNRVVSHTHPVWATSTYKQGI